MNLAKTLVFLFILPVAARRVQVEIEESKLEAQPAIPSSQCTQDISKPSFGQTIQSHFDSKRKDLGLLHGGGDDLDRAKTCTKRDVCLLMRQLDMDFYKRARAGTLTDADYNNPPDVTWLSSGSCRSHDRGAGKRYAPIMDEAACATHLSKSGVRGFSRKSRRVKTVSNTKYPAGCSIVVNNKKSRGSKGYIKVILNTLNSSTKEAGHVVTKGKSFHSWGKDQTTHVLCEHDRTLSPSAASYYSPYKLKQSMVSRTKMSTTCSFGMYAWLARRQETESSCAHILTHRTSSQYYSAQDALDKAEALERRGKSPEAAKIREYVEKVRQKFVLIDTIANQWCPAIWDESLATGGSTCAVPRVPDQSAEEEDDLEKLFDKDGNPTRLPKITFTDDFCSTFRADENLADVLAGVPEAPPDFFRDANIPDGTSQA